MIKPRAGVWDTESGSGFLLDVAVHLEVELNARIPKEQLCSTSSTTDPSEMSETDKRTTLQEWEFEARVCLKWYL